MTDHSELNEKNFIETKLQATNHNHNLQTLPYFNDLPSETVSLNETNFAQKRNSLNSFTPDIASFRLFWQSYPNCRFPILFLDSFSLCEMRIKAFLFVIVKTIRSYHIQREKWTNNKSSRVKNLKVFNSCYVSL